MPEADEAFRRLHCAFTTVPVFTQPDPERQFVVEVDASDEGVGAVLSQRSVTDNKIHPCAFFSKKLTAAERNYSVGVRELEEWCPLLDGAPLPYVVSTENRNLEYLKTAKHLNDRQARWSLFFARFNFTLTYRPGEKNVKPDAFSRIFEEKEVTEDKTIIPADLIIVTWEVEQQVKDTLTGLQVPHSVPANCLFVSEVLRPQVLQWSHTSRLAVHPGVVHALFILRQFFWWPRMRADVPCPRAALVANLVGRADHCGSLSQDGPFRPPSETSVCQGASKPGTSVSMAFRWTYFQTGVHN